MAVAAVPTTLIWSDGEKPGNTRSYNTVSAAKVDIPADAKVSWRIYLISSIPNDTISLIDIFAATDLSFIISCSPIIKVPVVCYNAISFAPVVPAFFAAYPIAPLARPLILAPWSTSPDVNAEHFNIVNVWMS